MRFGHAVQGIVCENESWEDSMRYDTMVVQKIDCSKIDKRKKLRLVWTP